MQSKGITFGAEGRRAAMVRRNRTSCMNTTRTAGANLRLLLILGAGALAVGAGAYGLREWQRDRTIQQSLTDGLAAYEAQNWKEAVRLLSRYVIRNTDRFSDPQVAAIARKYADANLSIHPLQTVHIRAAVDTYRRLLRDGEFDEQVCERLAFVYQSTGEPIELEYLARRLNEHRPGDPRVDLWNARAAVGKQDIAAARSILAAMADRLESQPEHKALFVRACLMLASLPQADAGDAARWLARAIDRAADDADARIARASLLRSMAERSSGEQRDEMLAAARADLEVAEQSESITAVGLRILCQELRQHDLFDRAASQLQRMRKLPREVVAQSYLDLDDWLLDTALQEISLHTKRGELQKAADAAELALKDRRAPQHRAALLPIAVELNVGLGRVDAAAELLGEYRRIAGAGNPRVESTIAYLQANIYMARGKPYPAIGLLQPFVPTQDFNDSMRTLLALLYQRVNQPARAAELFRGGLPADPRLVPSVLRSIDAEVRRGEYSAAEARLAELESRFPARVDVQLARIEADAMRGLSQPGADLNAVRANALDRLRSLKAAHPRSAAIRTQLAVMLVACQQLDAAEKELQDGIRECDASDQLQLQMARFYARIGQNDRAQKAFEEACRAFPEEASVWLAHAEECLRDRKPADARAVLDRALTAVKPESRDALARRLGALELQDDTLRQQGIGRLLRICEEDPADLDSRELLLQSPQLRLDRTVAQKLLDEIKSVEGEFGLRWRMYEAQLIADDLADAAPDERSPMLARAEELLNACVHGDPLWQTPVLLLGELLQMQERTADAERVYRRALDATLSAPVADRMLALLERQRRYGEALELMDRYLSAYADPRYASRRLTLALASGDPDLMSEQVQMLAANRPNDPQVLILSATLAYAIHRNAAEAERILRDAEKAGASPIPLTMARISILRSEGRTDEARKILDDMIATDDSIEARLLRGGFLTAIGDHQAAESDYKVLPGRSSDGSGHAHLAEFYAACRRYDDVIATCEAGLKEFPETRNLVRGLAKALFVRRADGDLEKAESVLNAIPDDELDTDLLRVKAMVAEALRRPDSVERVRQIVTRAAEHPRAALETYRGLVDLALRVNAHRQAEALLVAAQAEYGDSHPLIRLMWANFLIARGQYTSAVPALHDFVRRREADPEGYETLLSIPEGGASAATLRTFASSLDRGLATAESPRLRIAEARLLQRLNQLPLAADRLADYLKRKPPSSDDLDLVLLLVDLHKSQGRFDEAAEYLSRAESMAPKSPAVIMARIAVAAARADLTAVAALAAAARTDAEVPRAAADEIAIYAAQILTATSDRDRLAQSIPLLRESVAHSPEYVPHRLALALTLFRIGNLDEAETAYRETIEIDRQCDQALNNLAWIVGIEKKRPAEAVQFSQAAVDIRPDDPEYRETFGEILRGIPGRLEDARLQFTTALSLWDTNARRRARAYWKLGRVCHELNDRDEAARCLKKALQLDETAASLSQPAFEPEEKKQIEDMLRQMLADSRG